MITVAVRAAYAVQNRKVGRELLVAKNKIVALANLI